MATNIARAELNEDVGVFQDYFVYFVFYVPMSSLLLLAN